MKTDLPPSPPAFFPEARPRRPVGLIVWTAVLGALLAGAVIFAIIQTASLSSTRDDMAAAVAKGDEALAASQDENAGLQEDLDVASSQAVACEKAANLLAKGANGYAALWNEINDAADRWRFVFDFYLRGAMRRTNVPNATLSAGWDALDKCTTSGGTGGIDLA
jgi:hypothetical protein